VARRADHTRDELYDLALVAAQKIAEKQGLKGLTARRVATRIGYSTGTLYNVFDSFTDLIVHLNGRTLDALYDYVTAERPRGNIEAALKTFAHRYIHFTTERSKLWSIVFATGLPRGDQLPKWYHDKMHRLLGLLEEALDPLFGKSRKAERDLSVRVLWSSVHGVCSLVAAGVMVTEHSAKIMVDNLIRNYLAGIQPKRSRR
jgi:AcrR family transcriptional regulator